jgi:predicted dehydrogenase
MSRAAVSRDSILRDALTLAKSPLPKSPRPIIILGAGGVVRAAHLPAYEKAGLHVIAIADIEHGKAGSLASQHNISESFDSVTAAVRYAPPDVVFDIAVPASQLLNVLPSLPMGSAVLMQKPMGETLEQAQSIREICRERGFTAAVNFQLRYAPSHLGAELLARKGVLGELHDIEVQVRTYTPWHLWGFLARAPRLEILYHSIHYLDLIRSWLGVPLGIYAKTVRHPTNPQLAPTKSVMILDYGDEKRVFIATQHGHDIARSSQSSFVQWEGTEGAIRMGMGVNLDYPSGQHDTLSYIERGSGMREWQDLPVAGDWFPDAFIGSMGTLQAYLEGSVSLLPSSVDTAYETMAMVEAAYRSSERGGEPLSIVPQATVRSEVPGARGAAPRSSSG